jgi:hypothetical protein
MTFLSEPHYGSPLLATLLGELPSLVFVASAVISRRQPNGLSKVSLTPQLSPGQDDPMKELEAL